MRPKGSADELERRRVRAVGLLERGEARAVVARILGVCPGTLSRWKRLAASDGLKAKAVPGRPRSLTDDDCRELDQRPHAAAPHGVALQPEALQDGC